jgi:transposase
MQVQGLLSIIEYLSYFRLSQRCDNRKGWLFSDTPRGAKASAVYFTLIETAKANDIDPFKYILHLCKHIASAQTVEDIEALLPWNVKEKLTQTVKVN